MTGDDPLFLTLDEALEVHAEEIRRHGGSTGTRDAGLLAAALAMPRHTFDSQYVHTDLFEMAAAHLYHIAQNHPFVDGNKRVAMVCALTFLDINGVLVNAPDDEMEQLVMGVASGEIGKAQVAVFLGAHAEKLSR